MAHSKGFRHKTRNLKRESKHARGLSKFLTKYSVNDKVVIDIDPSQVKGMPHRRFQGKVGVVDEIRPRSLVISLPIGDKMKKIAPRLEHIRPHRGSSDSVEKTVAKSKTKTEAKPKVEAVKTKPTAKTVTKPTAKTVTKPTAKTVTKPTAKTVTKPKVEAKSKVVRASRSKE
jgi:large subunit ribosomal protein L21e